MDQAKEVLLKTVVTIQSVAPHVKSVGLFFSSALSAMFFTSLLMIQNTARLYDKVRPPVWAKIYSAGEALRPAGKICVA